FERSRSPPAIYALSLHDALPILGWRPALAPPTPKASWAERRAALRGVVDIGLLVVVVIGGIVFGWITPTEAAAVGAAGALLICLDRKSTRLNSSHVKISYAAFCL